MPRKRRRHPLPTGLFICPDCFEPRGTTPTGQRSTCLCEGVRCNWCGHVGHRPISNYYDLDEGEWLHTPSFGFMGHSCKTVMNPGIEPRVSNLPAAAIPASPPPGLGGSLALDFLD